MKISKANITAAIATVRNETKAATNHEGTKGMTVTTRNGGSAFLSKPFLRHLRRAISTGELLLECQPFNRQSLNQIFPWRMPLADNELRTPDLYPLPSDIIPSGLCPVLPDAAPRSPETVKQWSNETAKNRTESPAAPVATVTPVVKTIVKQVKTKVEQPTPAAAKPAAKGAIVKKLNWETVTAIREGKHGDKAKDIAAKLGLGETTVRDILKGKTWQHEPVAA